jgi:hypothetical protein
LKWWAHLAFGKVGFESGWVGIKQDPEEFQPESIDTVRIRLREMAGNVKFTFLARSDMENAEAWAEPNLHITLGVFEKEAKNKTGERTNKQKRRIWYNP